MPNRPIRPEFVGDAIYNENGVQFGRYGRFKLQSAYQPIWSSDAPGHFSIYGYEGLIRPFLDGKPASPYDFFSSIDISDSLFVDCLCHALHLRNYKHATPENRKLFFNVNPQTYADTKTFEHNYSILLRRLDELGIDRNQIILEVIETDERSRGVLKYIGDFCRAENIKLAIDDFGQKHSTIERYYAFMPDIVKVDRELFLQACAAKRYATELGEIIKQFHDNGTLAVIEGIETAGQLDVAVNMGADLFQGFYLARPHILPARFGTTEVTQETLLRSA